MPLPVKVWLTSVVVAFVTGMFLLLVSITSLDRYRVVNGFVTACLLYFFANAFGALLLVSLIGIWHGV